MEIESEWTAWWRERMGLAPELQVQENPRPSKVIPQGFINTWVDFNGVGYRGNLIKNNYNPTFESLAADAEGNLYVYDDRNEQIAKVSPWGEVSIVARTITTARK